MARRYFYGHMQKGLDILELERPDLIKIFRKLDEKDQENLLRAGLDVANKLEGLGPAGGLELILAIGQYEGYRKFYRYEDFWKEDFEISVEVER